MTEEEARADERRQIILQLMTIIVDNTPSWQGDQNNKIRKECIDLIRTRGES